MIMRVNDGHSVHQNISVSSKLGQTRTGPGSRTKGIMLKKNKGIVAVWRGRCVSVSRHVLWRSFGAALEPWRTKTLPFYAGPRPLCTALRYPPRPPPTRPPLLCGSSLCNDISFFAAGAQGWVIAVSLIKLRDINPRLRIFTLFCLNFYFFFCSKWSLLC